MGPDKPATFYKDAFLCTIFSFIVAGILYFSFINISILNPFSKAFKDFEFTDIYYSQILNQSEQRRDIVLVNIKHADRFQIAQAISKIGRQSPKTIGLDIIFKDRKMAFSDSLLNHVINTTDNIVTAYYHDKDSIVHNNAYFQFDNNKQGYINLNNSNAVIRNFIGSKSDSRSIGFATQLAIASGYIDESYAINELHNATPINYVGHKSEFLNFDIEEILQKESIPALKEAVVILGYLGDGNEQYDIEDKHFTPLNKNWVGRSTPDTYGAVIHANILNMLMQSEVLYRVPKFLIYIISFISCFIVTLLAMRLSKQNSLVFTLGLKTSQLIFTVTLLYIALLLLQIDIVLAVTPIIALSLFGIGMRTHYLQLLKYLNKKYRWESSLL